MMNTLNCNITEAEVFAAVSKLKSGKSPGLDGIPVEFVKSSIPELQADLVTLFNYVLSKEEYPTSWCEGLRIAIPKSGTDIRPITIEKVFPNFFEMIIDNRLNFINDMFNKGDKYNGGFVKDSMTQDNMLILTSCIQKQLFLGKNLYIAMVDFKKAFNFVNHSVLFYKILKSGWSGRCIRLLINMYSKIKAKVKINNLLYSWIKDWSGSNQGGPLSPNMFRFMLGDLIDYLYKEFGVCLDEEILCHLLWADDLILMEDSPAGLQKQLDGLFTFCSRFQMIVNETKTKVMIYGNHSGETFVFNGKPLEIVQEYKYLGVVLSSVTSARGNIYKKMPSYSVDKANKASFAVTKKCKSVGHLTPAVGMFLFETYVSPILNYACELWCDVKECPRVEAVQLKKIYISFRSQTEFMYYCHSRRDGKISSHCITTHQSIKILVQIVTFS